MSRFKARRDDIEEARERHTFAGSRLVRLYRTGKAWPNPRILSRAPEVRRRLIPATPRAAELGHDRLSDRDLRALAWFAAVALGFKKPGLAIRHADMAELLVCSPRTAGETIRRLVAMGLVHADPYFVAVPGGMARRESTYRLATEVLVFFRDLDAPSESCQAEETESSLRSDKKVSPVGDERRAPEEARPTDPRGRPHSGVKRALGAFKTRLEEQARANRAQLEGLAAQLRARVEPPPEEERPPTVTPLVAAVAAALACSHREAAAQVELARDHRARGRCSCAVCWTAASLGVFL